MSMGGIMKYTEMEEMVEEVLNENNTIIIAGVEFEAGEIVKKLDPILFRQMVLDLAGKFRRDRVKLICLSEELNT